MLLLLTACGGGRFNTLKATGYSVSKPISCVPYAREQSGIQIRGDAWTWWNKAPPRYERGQIPRPGSILVFTKTPRLTRGHIAVVDKLINTREINLNHSNWGSSRATRSVIYERQRARDVSPNNDWTQVRVWNKDSGAYGRPYAAYGFIYK